MTRRQNLLISKALRSTVMIRLFLRFYILNIIYRLCRLMSTGTPKLRLIV